MVRDYLKQSSLQRGRILPHRMDADDYDDFLRDAIGSKWASLNRRQILAFGEFIETERLRAA